MSFLMGDTDNDKREALILNACIQAGINTPRCQLSEKKIAELLAKFDPTKSMKLERVRFYSHKGETCWKCGGPGSKTGSKTGSGSQLLVRWYCRRCHVSWR